MKNSLPVHQGMTAQQLREAGCVESIGLSLCEMDPPGLYLFPEKWYYLIPNGTVVTDIFSKECIFKAGKTNGESRAGILPFGFVASDAEIKLGFVASDAEIKQ